jgi:hypothetical protein
MRYRAQIQAEKDRRPLARLEPFCRPYPAFPAAEKAAAQRRHDRWEPWPHIVGQFRSIPKIDSPKPCRATLDLRRHVAQDRW